MNQVRSCEFCKLYLLTKRRFYLGIFLGAVLAGIFKVHLQRTLIPELEKFKRTSYHNLY